MTDSTLGAYTFADAACRAADQRLESEVRAAIEAGDICALATRAYQPVAVRLLSHGLYSRVFADLLAGGFPLPLRVMRGFGLGETHKTYTKAQTTRRLRAATGRKAEIIAGLLTGEGDLAAVTLRHLAEAVRGVPLEVHDLSQAATRETVTFEERSESSKRAAVTRAQRHNVSPKSGRKAVTLPKTAAKRRAKRMEKLAATMRARAEREAAKEVKRAEVRARRQREAAERKRKRETADELSERIDYRESMRRGER